MAFGAGDVCHHAQFLPSEGDAAISGEPRQAGVRRAVSCAAHHAARRGESPQVHCLRHVHEQLSERYDTGRCSDGDRPRDRQAEAGTRQTPLQSRKLHFLRSVRFGLPTGSPSGSRTSSSMPSSRKSGCCSSSIGRALHRLRNRHPLRNRPLRRRKEGRHRRRLERNQKRNKSWKG